MLHIIRQIKHTEGEDDMRKPNGNRYFDNIEKKEITAVHTARELEALVATEKHRTVKRYNPREHRLDYKSEGSQLADKISTIDNRLTSIFDDYLQANGRLITQREYASEYYRISMEALVHDLRYRYMDEEQKRQARMNTWNRATRAHMGNLAQYQALLVLAELYPDATFYTSNQIDTTSKVDIIMNHDKKVYYIHSTSSSRKATNFNEQKCSSDVKIKDDSKDIYLKYHPTKRKAGESRIDSTKFIGEYPVFSKEYIQEQIEQATREGKYDNVTSSKDYLASRFFYILNHIERITQDVETVYKIRGKSNGLLVGTV